MLPLLFVDLADVPGPPIELRKHPVAFLAGKLATGWKWNQIYQLQTSNSLLTSAFHKEIGWFTYFYLILLSYRKQLLENQRLKGHSEFS